jgi:hypothetical protein
MANKDIKLKIDAAVESAEAAKSLGQLRRALLEIQELQSQVGETSGENFDKLAQASTNASQKLAETRDAIGDIQDRTRTLEGTPVERLTGSFGLLKDSILNLDFDKAKIGADGLLNAFTPVKDGKLVTGFKGIGGAVSNLGGMVKNLGSTFLSLGKALLTNPIFLLATAITLIVIGIIKLLDSLGLLKPMMDAIKIAIGAVVDAFEALTDWLGLTDNAGEEAAENAKKHGEDRIKAAEDTAKAQEELYNLTKDLTEDEIKLLEERLGVEIDTSKSIYDIRVEEAEAKKQALQDEVDALNAKKSLTDEDKQRLEELTGKIQEENNKIVQAEQQKQLAIIKGAKNADSILQTLRAKAISNENDKSKAFLDIAEKEAIAKLEQAKRDAKQLGDDATVKKLEEAITLTKADFAKQRKSIDDGANKAAADAQKKAGEDALNNAKSNTNKQLKELEKAEKIKVNATKEGTQERLDAELNFINEIEKYQKKNASMLGLNQKDLTLIYQENEKKREKLREEFQTAETEKNNRIKLAASELAVLEAKTDEERLEAQKKFVLAQRDIDVSNKELTTDEIKKIEIEAANEITAINNELTDLQIANNQKLLDNAALTSQTKLSQAEFDAARTQGTFAEEAAEIDNIKNLQLEALETERLAKLNNKELSEAEIAAIEEDYRQKKKVADETAFEGTKELTEKTRQLKIKEFSDAAEWAQKGATAVQGISDALFAFKKNRAEKGSKEEEAIAKKQFKVNKALQLGMAVIDGFKAITTSLSQSPIAIGPVPNPAGIASLAFAAITTATNIAKIAASKFEASTPGAPPPTPDVGGGGGEGEAAAASFSPTQFFGLGQGGPQSGGGANGATRVYVTETDITSTQNRVRVIEDRAVIG